ncbi:MAG: sulfatase family protein [Planctomycetota bacterium]|jgi:arylsulfatase A-like enzyme
MNRRSFVVLLLAALFAASTVGSASGAESTRPNVLLIMTDQQAADAMSCRIGQQALRTPAMDGLAAEGMLFANAYCANPLCVPSRTSTFTGRYPHTTGVQTNKTKPLDPAAFPCLGTVFRRAGYDTGYVGKWHLPFARKDASSHGFDYMENIKGNGGDSASPEAAAWFLRRARTKPFLLVVSFVNPHNICEWARGERLPDGPVGEPPPIDACPPLRPNHRPPENETDVVSLMRRSYQSARLFPVSGFDAAKWRQYAWAYYRMIEMVDGHVGTVLDSLGESGQQANTLIVFTSDHGDCQGAHAWNQKTVFYDESSRVPLIVTWPGVTAAGTSNRLVHTGVDLLPTLCDYAGIPLPDGLPGLSFKATANGRPTHDPRQYLVVSNKMIQGEPIDGVKPEPEGRMVRSRRYKYCVYSLGERRESLVDVQNDPGETINLADGEQHRTTLDEHRRHLRQFCEKHDDPFLRFVPDGR